jgi:hypothetical protein
MLSGVLLPALTPTISTATLFVVLIAPTVEVIEPVFAVACRPRWPESGVTENVPLAGKVMLPELAFTKMAVPPEAFEVVLP